MCRAAWIPACFFTCCLLTDHGKTLTPSCFFPCGALELKARVSLNRIEEFLGRLDIEGQPADKDLPGSGDTADRPRAPVGGLLVQNGTFAWPQTVSSFRTDQRVLLPGVAISCGSVARKLRGYGWVSAHGNRVPNCCVSEASTACAEIFPGRTNRQDGPFLD